MATPAQMLSSRAFYNPALYRRRSSVVELRFRKPWVGGSNPPAGLPRSKRRNSITFLLLLVMLDTGLRVSDAVALRWKDIDKGGSASGHKDEASSGAALGGAEIGWRILPVR